jgi:hypothetical protein
MLRALHTFLLTADSRKVPQGESCPQQHRLSEDVAPSNPSFSSRPFL